MKYGTLTNSQFNIKASINTASDKTAGFDDLRQAVLILGMELDRLVQAKLDAIEAERMSNEMAEYYDHQRTCGV